MLQRPLLNSENLYDMKKYAIKITDRALYDMAEIYRYISNHLGSTENALHQYNRIAEAIEKLNFYPARIKLLDSEPEHSLGFRQLQVDSYIVIFVIDNNIVNIVRVLYSASDFRKKLLNY